LSDFFDIMGFKDFVYKNDHEEVKNQVQSLTNFKEALKHINSPNARINELIRSIVVSDSVIISTRIPQMIFHVLLQLLTY
jgi:hypothetical protein